MTRKVIAIASLGFTLLLPVWAVSVMATPTTDATVAEVDSAEVADAIEQIQSTDADAQDLSDWEYTACYHRPMRSDFVRNKKSRRPRGRSYRSKSRRNNRRTRHGGYWRW